MRQFLESGQVNGIGVRLELVYASKPYNIEHPTLYKSPQLIVYLL